jgi:HlyD family secretion protein
MEIAMSPQMSREAGLKEAGCKEAGSKSANADHRVPARAGYAVIFITFGVCGLWAAKAPLDSAAVAQGQIEVDSRRKPIQHLEGGIVKEILVREAQAVRQDQVLFRLEPTPARANSDMLRKQLGAVLAQEARLIAELDGKPEISFPREIAEDSMIPETALAITDARRQFAERRQSIENQVRGLEARIEQTAHEMTGRARQHAALTSQIESITGQIAAVGTLVDKGWYPRNRVLEQERDKARLVGDLGQASADIARLAKQQDETRTQIEQLRQRFREDSARDLADARGRLSDVREKLAIAGDVLTRIEIRAPMAGIVQNLRVNGAGAVVKAGDTIAELIPAGEELVVAAQVSPLDIDSVAAGQKAEIRFTSLSRRQAPTVFGQVQSVSADALLNETTKQSYYLARVVVARADMPAATVAKLMPGMPADVLIVTGERSALDYLVGPLRNALSKGMREE